MLSGDTTGFERAVSARSFDFPHDHGPHPGFKTEWWYYTGNMQSEDGDQFGFQLTFFRSALAPRVGGKGDSLSGWRTNQVYMAHLALSDVARGEFFAYERFSRAANGLAGAQAVPFRVWLEDWSSEATGAPGAPVPDMRLSAKTADVALALTLSNMKPPVLQGDGGLSQKGRQPGNASYYYSLTRMSAAGAIVVRGQTHDVKGTAWMDREWSTSVLEDDQVGWDWFSLQLDDASEIMVYRLRRRDGTPDPHSRLVLVDSRGRKTDLVPEEFRLSVDEYWESPRGAIYPSGWRLTVENHAIDLVVAPVMSDQELDLSFRYWEGAVRASGTHEGVGYAELTGYDAP